MALANKNENKKELVVLLSRLPEEVKLLLPVTPEKSVPTTQKESVTLTPEKSVKITPKKSVTLTPEKSVPITPKKSVTLTPEKRVPITPKKSVTLTPKKSITLTPEKSVPITPEKSVPITPEKSVTLTPEKRVPITPKKSVTLTPEKSVPITPEKSVPLTPEEIVPIAHKNIKDCFVLVTKIGEVKLGKESVINKDGLCHSSPHAKREIIPRDCKLKDESSRVSSPVKCDQVRTVSKKIALVFDQIKEQDKFFFVNFQNSEMGINNSSLAHPGDVSEIVPDLLTTEYETKGLLDECPPDRSDGSDSGLGSEITDERTVLKTDSLSSDELNVPPVDGCIWEPLSYPGTSGISGTEETRPKSMLKRRRTDPLGHSPVVKKQKKSIAFGDVQVYYFPRTQGFTCVPSQGGSTLGMQLNHSERRVFSITEHVSEQRRVHREIMSQIRSSSSATTSSSSDSDTDDQNTESELDPDTYFFLQPVPTRQRRALLRAAGVRKIDTLEKDDCRDIRTSREFCGCACKGFCDPDTCACSQAGIKCQVDRLNFPCGCTHDGCANSNGRIEFNPMRVRTHFIHTMMRLEMEKKREDETGITGLPLSDENPSPFQNFPYRDDIYSYPYDQSQSTSFSYNYNYNSQYGPDITNNIEFHQQQYESFQQSFQNEQRYQEESKLESFSDLLQGRYSENVLEGLTSLPEEIPTTSSKPNLHEECEAENFGEIIKKTMVESATA